mgnify:CR=1 FL=1
MSRKLDDPVAVRISARALRIIGAVTVITILALWALVTGLGLVKPVFRDGKLFAWMASVGHWLDIGGNVPGGYNPKAVESFQEGMRLPPVKLFRAGVIQKDITAILDANSRLPMSNWGDLNGQLNALDLGETRLHALLDEYGDATIAGAFEAFSDRAEAMMRAAITAIPDGKYSFEDVLDNDGIVDEPLTVALDATVTG